MANRIRGQEEYVGLAWVVVVHDLRGQLLREDLT